jgi:hypothetical protein
MNLLIDHVTVCGSNLEKMREDFAGVGLHTSYGGRHSNGITHMDLLTFPDGSYIELIAPVSSMGDASGITSGWSKLMEGNAGPGAWAVRTDNIHAEAVRLRSMGIEVRGPEAGSRHRPDGARLEWETAIVGPGPAGSVLPFLIQDKTARERRVPDPAERSGITGVSAVVIGVRDLDSSIAVFQQSFGLQDASIEGDPEFGATLAYLQNTPVILATPADGNSWLANRLQRFGECPAAFLLQASSESPSSDFPAATKFTRCFGREVAWFDSRRLHETRLGLIR